MPDRPSQLAHVNFARPFTHLRHGQTGDGFLLQSGRTRLRKEPLMANQNVFVP
jgi:hypothetical protein